MPVPFHPSELIPRLKSIEGFSLITDLIPLGYVYKYIDNVVEDYVVFPEGQGFGNGDFTYAVKSLIDYAIAGNRLPLKTEFSPNLKIVEK